MTTLSIQSDHDDDGLKTLAAAEQSLMSFGTPSAAILIAGFGALMLFVFGISRHWDSATLFWFWAVPMIFVLATGLFVIRHRQKVEMKQLRAELLDSVAQQLTSHRGAQAERLTKAVATAIDHELYGDRAAALIQGFVAEDSRAFVRETVERLRPTVAFVEAFRQEREDEARVAQETAAAAQEAERAEREAQVRAERLDAIDPMVLKESYSLLEQAGSILGEGQELNLTDHPKFAPLVESNALLLALVEGDVLLADVHELFMTMPSDIVNGRSVIDAAKLLRGIEAA